MKKIILLAGDGIGPEVCEQAEKILKIVAKQYELPIHIDYGLVGGTCYDQTGTTLEDSTLEKCKNADAILLGAVGGPKWESLDFNVRPERGLLKLRSELELFANLRPAVIYGDLVSSSSLKKEVIEGVNMMIIRELTGGIYFGQPRGVTIENGVRVGRNTLIYDENEIRRIAKKGFEIARLRDKKLCSIDKANVLESTELWREIMIEESENFPDVELSHLYVDNAAMQLVRNPKQFDTIVTTNMFGDIISDAAAMATGSLGMLPSASLGVQNGLYEPVHGSAPDIAGQDKANPLATVLSVGMMFQYSFQIPEANTKIENAVVDVLKTHRTFDIQATGTKLVGCKEMGEILANHLENL